MMIAIEEAEQLQRLSQRMIVFTEPTRLQIIRLLLEHGRMNVRQLTEQMNKQGRAVPQSNISRHLKVLLDAGYLSCTGVKTSHFYAIEQTEIRQVLAQLQEYTGLPS